MISINICILHHSHMHSHQCAGNKNFKSLGIRESNAKFSFLEQCSISMAKQTMNISAKDALITSNVYYRIEHQLSNKLYYSYQYRRQFKHKESHTVEYYNRDTVSKKWSSKHSDFEFGVIDRFIDAVAGENSYSMASIRPLRWKSGPCIQHEAVGCYITDCKDTNTRYLIPFHHLQRIVAVTIHSQSYMEDLCYFLQPLYTYHIWCNFSCFM